MISATSSGMRTHSRQYVGFNMKDNSLVWGSRSGSKRHQYSQTIGDVTFRLINELSVPRDQVYYFNTPGAGLTQRTTVNDQ